jgi:hypothetical protein
MDDVVFGAQHSTAQQLVVCGANDTRVVPSPVSQQTQNNHCLGSIGESISRHRALTL